MIEASKIKIGLVDDHSVLRSALSNLLSSSEDYSVILEAENGRELIAKLDNSKVLPDLILLDINMPIMDGYDTLKWLKSHHQSIKVIIFTMYDSESNVVRMIKVGADGYVLKNVSSKELFNAIKIVIKNGSYFPEWITERVISSIRGTTLGERYSVDSDGILFSEKELMVIKLVCRELTIKEIANELCLSPRTVDGYIQSIFQKLNLKSRTGLILYAIKNKIVNVDTL